MHTELMVYANTFLECAQKLCPENPDLDRLRDSLEWLDASPFRILVVGSLRNGRTTFINAWMGRNALRWMGAAYTVTKGSASAEEITVYYWDSLILPKKLPLENLCDFIPDCRPFNGAETDFSGKDVKLIEVAVKTDFPSRGIEVINAPDLEEDALRIHTTREFVSNANAIIFVLSAANLLSSGEQRYIAENFAGRGLRNVFFVVNRIDTLAPDELENRVIPAVRAGLSGTFTDTNGVLDETLYRKRVFYTNAYGAQCIRTGNPIKLILGKKEVPVDLELEDTGFPEFEAAFDTFYREVRQRQTISIMDGIYGRAALMITPHSPQLSVRHSHRNQQPETETMLLQTMREYLDACKALACPS